MSSKAEDHFYTIDWSEIGTKTVGVVVDGYLCEGVAGYCYKNKVDGSIPLYRYWNPFMNNHLYTTSPTEIGIPEPGSAGKYGYRYEGIECYVFR